MNLPKGDALKYGLIATMILAISILHYETAIEHRYLHEIYQRIYYIPILLAAFWFGPWIGLLAAFFTSCIYIVHIERDWTSFPVYSFNQYAEIVLYHLIAVIIGVLSLRERRQRSRLEKTSKELSAAYERLRQTFERLRKSERLAALGELSAGIAHEIRNPLGSIKGSIEILEGELTEAHPKHEFIQIIKEEVARLNSLVAEFLKFARPPEPSIEKVSIHELIRSTLVLISQEAEKAAVEVQTSLDESVTPLSLDPDQIRQVLLNVFLNAIQSMPAGGRLQVTSLLEDAGERVILEIADSGEGVSGDLERIFDPFFTTRPDGTGLGLAVSHQLVENHGGVISVRRNPEQGLTFRIELPTGLQKPSGVPTP
jgi:signal transduction histidine kinase